MLPTSALGRAWLGREPEVRYSQPGRKSHAVDQTELAYCSLHVLAGFVRGHEDSPVEIVSDGA